MNDARDLTCPKCGMTYRCDPAGDCWCKSLPPLRPVPANPKARCLCPCELKAMVETERAGP